MNYEDLKDVIRHLKKVFPCNTCEKKFINEGIKVLTACQNEVLFHMSCYNCMNQLIVHVTMVDHDCDPNCEATEKMELEIETHDAPSISENDVLDIHNFLNKFNGDFKNLFQYK